MSQATGRTIRIFLADGTPNGVRRAEILSWTGNVLVAPRARLPDLLKRSEAQKTGVYILSGIDPEDPQHELLYIGEADCIAERLLKHNRDDRKDFFTQICFVVSKDDNLTKAHARYLESRLVELATKAKRVWLMNGTAPSIKQLSEFDRADMEFFLELLNLVLFALGYNFTQPTPTLVVSTAPASDDSQDVFEMIAVGVKALAVEAGGEFVVIKESQARKEGTASWTSYRSLRDKLIEEGKLVESGQPGTLLFKEDVAFDSPSAAATVVYAGNQNGRTAWRLKRSGQTYKDWQESQIGTV